MREGEDRRHTLIKQRDAGGAQRSKLISASRPPQNINNMRGGGATVRIETIVYLLKDSSERTCYSLTLTPHGTPAGRKKGRATIDDRPAKDIQPTAYQRHHLREGPKGRQMCKIPRRGTLVNSTEDCDWACEEALKRHRKLFNAMPDERCNWVRCTVFPTGTQTVRKGLLPMLLLQVRRSSILKSDRIHFLSCGAWILTQSSSRCSR